MKIVCEACQAKYSISDDKVRGKAFKIRCKKCSHIIVVRSTSASMPTVGDGSSAAQLPISEGSGLSGLTSPAPSENSWHIVVEGEQVGPLSPSDVRARLSRGEITGESFIWREGMADWLKISTVPEFASAGGDDDAGTPFPTQPPTTVYPPGTAESAFAASPQGGDQEVFAAPTMVSSSPSADLFAAPASAPEPASSSFSFGSSGAQMESGGGGRHAHGNGASSGGGSLTGQRHENSVLFSLSNLEALASPAASPSSMPRPGVSNSGGSEGSGLIDIRSMAAMTLGSQSDTRHSNNLPTFGAPQFSPVAPVLLPLGPSGGPSKAIYILIGVGLLVAGAVAIATMVVLRKPTSAIPTPAPAVAVAPAPAAAPAAAPTTAAPPTSTAPPVTPPAAPNEVLPPREAQKPASAAKGGGKKGGKPVKGGRPGDTTGVASATTAPPATSPPKADTSPNLGKRDKLDDLLDSALGSKPKAAPRQRDDEPAKPAPAAASSLPALEKSDIVRAMMALNPKVHECFNQFKVPGTAMVTLKLSRGGKVTDTSVGGKFANTPTGTCVESAARGAKFPATEAQTIQYPFSLH